MKGRRAPLARLGVLVGCAALLAACTLVDPLDEDFQVAPLTVEGEDVFSLTESGGVVTARGAAANTGGNTRFVFWPTTGVPAADQTSCATWQSLVDGGDPGVQQGVALRVRVSETSTRAITVTKNIAYGFTWVFNVHVWDSSLAQPFTQIGEGVDLGQTFLVDGVQRPLPWRICARTAGAVVELKVWPLDVAEPMWGDPRYGGRRTVPADYLDAGFAGWYVGHLGAGDELVYRELQVDGRSPVAVAGTQAWSFAPGLRGPNAESGPVVAAGTNR